jgi:hypothetical protein
MTQPTIIYILTNPAMPGYVKIGQTGNLQKRLSSLDNTSLPLPFECYFAMEVQSSQNVERLLHDTFANQRVRKSREFFEIDPERVVSALRLTDGEEVTLDDQSDLDSEAKEAIEKTKDRRSPFSFKMIGISEGATLSFYKEEAITCQVLGNNKILFEGQIMSLSASALLICQRMGFQWKTVAGPTCWMFEGETLRERRLRLEEE